MKKNRLLYTYCIVALSTIYAITSCDNVLDKDPVDSFNEESLFQDLNLVEAFLYQCYDQIGGDHEAVLGMREDLLSSATDELLNIHRAGTETFTKATLTPSYLGHYEYNSSVSFRHSWIVWDHLYLNIKNVNTILDGIDQVPLVTSADEAKAAQIKAEAYFIRAFSYTNLLRSYGGVVLSDKVYGLNDDFLIPTRATLQETVDFILADIEKAIQDLPLKADIDQGRATRGAAGALKSRLLSFITGELMNGGYEPSNALVSFQSGSRTERLQAAKNAAKDVIDGKYGHYALTGSTTEPSADMTDEEVMAYANNYAGIFLQKGAWDDELIFGVQYTNNKKDNRVRNNLFWGPNGYNCWGNNEPIEDLVREYEMKDGTPFQWDKYNSGEMNIRAFTKAQEEADPERNPYMGREPRFYASILFDGSPWRERAATNDKVQIGHTINSPGSGLIGKSLESLLDEVGKLESVTVGGMDSRSAANQAWNGTKTGYYLRKMLDVGIDGETDDNENSWTEIRFAEVILDYAEACIELGEIEEGLKAVNLIRNRAGLPGRSLTASPAQAKEWYRHERLIEMMAEGDRWYCIRKWMICKEAIKSFSPTYIYHFEDGVSIYAYNTKTLADERKWLDRQYWLPISITETNKAPQLQQNPGY